MQDYITLLVVDEEPDFLFDTSRLLNGIKLNVITAKSGNECLEKAADSQPDLVLLNINLPDMNAFNICQYINQHSDSKNVLLILADKEISQEEKAHGLEAGADGFIRRPVSEQNFLPWLEATKYVQRVYKGREAIKEQYAQISDKSKVKWGNIFEAIGHPAIIMDPDHTILNVNQAASDAAQQPREKLIGRKCYEIYHNSQAPPQGCPLEKIKQSGHLESEDMEIEAVGRTFLVSCTPVFSKDNKLDKIIHIATDITDRKKMEKALKQSEERFKNLFGNLTMGLYRTRPDGKILMANPALVKMLGFSSFRELAARDLEESGYEPEYPRTGFKEKMQKDGEIVGLESAWKRKDGTTLFVRESAKAIKNADGEVMYYEGTVEDITERKLAEKALRENERFLNAVFQSIQDGISVLDTDLTVRYVNQTMNEWHSSKLPLPGKKCYNAFHNREEPCTNCPTMRCIESGRMEHNVISAKPGSSVEWLELFSYPIVNEKSQVSGVVEFVRNITEQKQAEDALQESEAKYRQLIEQSNDAIYLFYNNRFEIVNEKFCSMFSTTLEELFDPQFNFMDFIAEESNSLIRERLEKQARGEKLSPTYEFKALTKDGREIEVEASVSYIRYKEGQAVQGILRDVTERKSLEEQLRQSQKMQAVGQLAGGIAHDFNNLLTVINGHSEMLIANVERKAPLFDKLHQINRAGQRAASLTRQLLAFSRKQILQPKIINLNDLIATMEKLLRRLIGEDIILDTFYEENLASVKADPGQLEQIIMNLAVNSRDAMPYGGQLTIETHNVYLDEDYVKKHEEANEGFHVLLSVTDNGTGMDKATQERIFDPFFTTKEVGRGTGLGLSTVYGIVKQSGGDIQVNSEPERGTSIKIYLPAFEEPKKKFLRPQESMSSVYGNETILIVEDEEAVLELVEMSLKELGYKILTAKDGLQAIEKVKEYNDKIDLVLSDVVMPNMSGKEVAEKVRDYYPEIAVCFMSGYTDNAIMHHGILEANKNFIQKPFAPKNLAKLIRKILDEK